MRDLPPQALSPRHQQRKKLHGPVLGAISAQVPVQLGDGTSTHYDALTWKAWFKRRYGIDGSSEDLDDEDYAAFVWWVEVQGAEMGVVYPEQPQ